MTIKSLGLVCSISRMASAMAWALSSAGIIPSARDKSSNASKASLSETTSYRALL